MHEPDWSLGKRIAFRFAFAWFVLIDLPFPLTIAPQLEPLTRPFDAFWDAVATFTGSRIFGVAVKHVQTGSGDTTYDWLVFAATFALAVLITIVWSVADRRRTEYGKLYAGLRIYVRFSLSAAMLSYGAYKVIPAQFPPPTLFRLTERFGDASPMGLLWALMGASVPYEVFAGAGEMLGGVLLVFRRTTLLGALVSSAVLANVVMLNFSYDVPVKLYSSVLLIHALFLILPDVRPLFRFLVPRLERPRVAAIAASIVFIAVAAGVPFAAAHKQRTMLLSRSPLFGIWNVDSFASDGTALPPLTADPFRWRRLIIQGDQGCVIDFMDDRRERYRMQRDAAKQTLTIAPFAKPDEKSTLHYSVPRRDTLVVEGGFRGRKVAAAMHAADLSKLLLVNRGFHWINETPFNR